MGARILRKYGVQTTITFELYETDGTDLKSDAVHALGDTKIMKDEGAEANTSNGFTDEGQGYSIVLTATEMQAARIVVYVVDQATKAWLDKVLHIETYGNASAMHAFDLDTALSFTTGNVHAHVKAEDNIDFGATKKASINTEADTALSDYDPPTKAEMDAGFAALNDLSAAQINAEVDTALADIDLDHLIKTSFGGAMPTIGSLLDVIMNKDGSQTFSQANDALEALRDRGDAAWITATGFSTHDAAAIWAVGTRALTDKAGFSLSAAGIDGIVDEVIEGTLTLRQAIRLTIAMMAGKSSGGATATLKYRDYGDTKDRLTFTVDADGNRSVVVRDVS